MKVGLIDVDSHNYPNLALMKLSAYHKQQGDVVEWYDSFSHYDLVYQSKVFTASPDYRYPVNASRIIKGGTGYAINDPGGETYNKAADQPLLDERWCNNRFVFAKCPRFEDYGKTIVRKDKRQLELF